MVEIAHIPNSSFLPPDNFWGAMRVKEEKTFFMQNPKIPVLLLTGYLGSGKTTLLNRILSNSGGIRFAIIVNDIGEVNIDADLIREGGIVGQNGSSDDLVALQNGCICCTLQSDLLRQLADLADSRKFDYIVIEASGICEPEPIARAISGFQAIMGSNTTQVIPYVDSIVTVVDALRMKTEFGCGEDLDRDHVEEEDIENLIIRQIEFCNTILLNKTDEVEPKELDEIRRIIRELQPLARIIDCNYCDVDVKKLLHTGVFDFETVATSAAWVREIERPADEFDPTPHGDEEHPHDHDDDHGHHHHEHDDHHHYHHHHHHGEGEAEEYGIGTYVYLRRQPFNFEKFDRFVNLHWPKEIIRTKGVLYFSHNRDMSLLFEQAGVQKNLREAGLWYATAPVDELRQLMAVEPGLMRDWDEEYGDRMIKLIFIGRNMDIDRLTRDLDNCLEKK